jgi:hypothetical protein
MSSRKLLYIATSLLWAGLISVASAAAPAKANSKSAADKEIERVVTSLQFRVATIATRSASC